MGLTTSDGDCGCSSNTGGTTPGNEFAQNNVGRRINAGFIYLPATPSNMYEGAVEIAVAEKLQAQGLTITEIETPVRINVVVFVNNQAYKKHKLFFYAGKGKYGNGTGDTFLSATMLEIVDTQDLTLADFPDNPFTITIDLGEVPDGDYLSAANSGDRDLSDSSKTYLFKYTRNGKTYLLSFDGDAGYYGGTYPDLLNYGNLNPVTDSDATPSVTRTDQLENTGESGTSKFATEAELNGLTLVVNQSAAEMYLKNAEGQNLATISLAFLNNEGTTFFYNATTQKLELKNDAGEILSEVPVSAFVSGLIHSVEFNGSTPYLLEFKDSAGNVVDSVSLALSNIQGLTAALASKANTNGSNATGNWPINITGQSVTTINWGGSAADLSADSTDLLKLVGTDSVNTARRYTASSVKTWLAIAMTDVSGLVTALSNIATTLAGKANTDGSNASGLWPINITGYATYANDSVNWTPSFVSDFNAQTGFKLLRSYGNPNNGPTASWGQGIQFSVNNDPFYVNQLVFDQFGNLYTRTKNVGTWGQWNKIPVDADVLHKIGEEVKYGGLGLTTAGPGNPYLQVLATAVSSFPLLQLIDSPRGGKDWNIENGRIAPGVLGLYSTDGGDVINISQIGNIQTNKGGVICSRNATGDIYIGIDTNNSVGNIQGANYAGTIPKDITIQKNGGFTGFGKSPTVMIDANGNIKSTGVFETDGPSVSLKANGNASYVQVTGGGGYAQIDVRSASNGGDINFYGGANRYGSISGGFHGASGSLIGDLYLRTFNAGVPTNNIFIDGATGNVGIQNTNPLYKLDVNGGGRFSSAVTIPDGTADNHAASVGQVKGLIISATANIDIPAIPGGTSQDVTVNVSGAAIGDNVIVQCNPGTSYPAGLLLQAFVLTAGVVTIRATSMFTSFNINLPALDFKIRIIK